MIGVYTIRHIASGKVYVGSSVDVSRRLKAHLSNLRNGKHRNSHLQRAWDKYGAKAFEFTFAEQTTREELIATEQRWIDSLEAANPLRGFNACPVAASVGSLPKSEEHRRKIGAAHKGKKRSQAAKDRMSAAMTGKKRAATSPAHAAKLSAAKKGKPMSEAAKAKLSVAKTGIKTGPCSLARRAAISAAQIARHAANKQ